MLLSVTAIEEVVGMESILRGILGIFVLVAISYFLSRSKKAIPWKLVVSGLCIQIIFALAVLKVPLVAGLFETISSFFVIVLNFTKQGSEFVFGNLVNVKSSGFIFAFQVLPTIIFFSALTSLLFYLGVLQKIVYALAWILGKTLKISGAENLSTAANIFLGQTEAPLLIKPYLAQMNRSEMLLVMIGGMASIAGGVLAAYVGFLGGDDPVQQLYFAKHLLAASVMSAPAAIVISKILIPQEQSVSEVIPVPAKQMGSNMLESIVNGTEEGLKLAFNVGSMLIVFIAMVAMVNYIFGDMIGSWTGLNSVIADWSGGRYQQFSLQAVLGYLCAPLVWLLGVSSSDMLMVGQLLGEKTVLNEFVAYISLGTMKTQQAFTDEKSIIIATYMLCGFANISSIGIQIGGIGALAPTQKKMLSELGVLALIGGTLAALMTATIVGMLY